MHFEKLIASSEAILRKALWNLDIHIQSVKNHQTPTFVDLSAECPTSFGKGIVAAWREKFPPDLLDLFYQQQGEALSLAVYGR